jgi:predicted amidohydrolase
LNRREFILLATSAAAAASAAPALPDKTAELGAPKISTPLVGSARAERSSINVLGIPFKTGEGQNEKNVEAASQIIRKEMAKERVDLVVLPELFTCGYCGFDLSPFAEAADGPSAQKFAALSRELDVLIGFGFAESSGKKKVYNSWMLIEPDSTKHVYRKTHLHPTERGGKTNEPEFLLAGDRLEPFKTRLGKIGVMICYDGCFVEVPRVLALKGADFLLWPSRSGEYLAGQSLPHVRCLDNVITIVQIEGGQTGEHFPFEGWSTVYSQNGSRILSQRKDTTPFRVTIDLAAGRRLRASTDAGAHTLYRPRRPELYSAIAKPS